MQPVLMGRRCRSILTKEARAYIREIGWEIRTLMRKEQIKPVSDYCGIDLWFILPRTNCDAHNYGKVLFDAMEAGGLVTNDKYILPRVMGVWHDSKSEVIAKIPNERPQQFELFMDGA
jgi:Holliday junction resolvase RusA-like endonuclease